MPARFVGPGMAGLLQVLSFPFWVCFGWGNKNIVGGAHKRLDTEEASEPPVAVTQRVAAAESIAYLDHQLDAAREVVSHEEQRAAELHQRAKALYTAGRHTEAKQAMTTRLLSLEAAKKMGVRIMNFERTLNTLKLNAVDAQFTSMLRAAAEAARAQATGSESEEISKLQHELNENIRNTERAKGIMDDGLSKEDVYIDETGAAVSMQEMLDQEMRALAAEFSVAPAVVAVAQPERPATVYRQGIAPAPAPARTAAAPKNKIAIV